MADTAHADDHGGRAGHQQRGEPLDGVVRGEARIGVRRDGGRLDAGRERHERTLGHQHVVGEAAVDGETRELVMDAEHVDAASAGHAHAAAVRWEDEHRIALGDGRDAGADLLHPARVLVSEHARQRDSGGLHEALDGMQIGRADARAADADEDVRRTDRLWHRALDELERLVILGA